MEKEKLINEFIRDITKVHPMTKSEARRRLGEILEAVGEEIVQDFADNEIIETIQPSQESQECEEAEHIWDARVLSPCCHKCGKLMGDDLQPPEPEKLPSKRLAVYVIYGEGATQTRHFDVNETVIKVLEYLDEQHQKNPKP